MQDCTNCKYRENMCKWPCYDCVKGDKWEEQSFTNADRIRAMTDEELAKTICWCPPPFKNCNNLCDICSAHDDDCEICWLCWLKQEVSND